MSNEYVATLPYLVGLQVAIIFENNVTLNLNSWP